MVQFFLKGTGTCSELSCEECAMTQPMQPCEACPNWYAQQKLKERK